jgi:monofunctional glycosyltransferase
MNPDEEEPKPPEGEGSPESPPEQPEEPHFEAAPEPVEPPTPEPEIVASEPPAPSEPEVVVAPPEPPPPAPEPEIVAAAPPPPEPPELPRHVLPREPAPPPQIITAPPQESAPHDEEPLFEPAPRAPDPRRDVPLSNYIEEEEARDEAFADFGVAEIPMPSTPRRGDKQRARDARINLDLDLGRIKRRKRYGFFLTTLSVIFIAFILAPVTWTAAYLFFDPPSTMLMMQRAAEGQTIRHYPIPLNRMSPHIVRAVIAAEDANFCTHDGFDIEAIQDAMESNARGGRTRGASTISQQVAKNLFLWPERSWVRKGFETYFTALVEFMWPKRRIIEAYLNAAEWGDGNFGIEAAARARFGVAAADLTPLQAARLAAVLPSPNRWSAESPGPYVRRRSASIVERARVVRNERTASCALIMDRPNSAR